MDRQSLLKRITIEKKSGGKPMIASCGLSVESLLSLLDEGRTWDALIETHSGLTEEDIHACLAFHFKTSPGLVIADSDGKVESVDPRIEEIFGQVAIEVIGGQLSSFFADPESLFDSSAAKTSSFMEKLLAKTLSREGKLQCRRKSGEEFAAVVSVSKFETLKAPRYFVEFKEDWQ